MDVWCESHVGKTLRPSPPGLLDHKKNSRIWIKIAKSSSNSEKLFEEVRHNSAGLLLSQAWAELSSPYEHRYHWLVSAQLKVGYAHTYCGELD